MQSLPPRRWAEQPLLSWSLPTSRVLGLLCYMQVGLLAAGQSTRPSVTSIEAEITEGKEQAKSGRIKEGLGTLQRAARAAELAGDPDRQAKALRPAAACQILLLQYRAALESSAKARDLALSAKDYTEAGAAALNLSTIFAQLGDFPSALNAAEESAGYLKESPRKDYLTKSLVNRGDIEFELGESGKGEASLREAITSAGAIPDRRLQALGWEHLGTSWMIEGRISKAEPALQRAFEIRSQLNDVDGLALSNEHAAELEIRRASPNYRAALAHINAAFGSVSTMFKTSPQWYPIHVRGQILLGLGQKNEALADFQHSVTIASQWRQGALPGDTTSTHTVAYLHEVYEDYAGLAAEFSLQKGDPELARQAWEALAENRAASLREQLTASLSKRALLPPEYFKLLSELQSAQSRVTLGQGSTEDEAKLADIRLQLSDLENKIGLQTHNFSKKEERNPYRNSLKHIQDRLGENDLLLSFCLGSRKSFLWAVTGNQVNLYELPRDTDIAKQANAFSNDVRNHRNADPAGKNLSGMLFGKLPAPMYQKRNWLITPDGALIDAVPFAALPEPDRSGGAQPIIVTHTLRTLPSELLLLTPGANTSAHRFIGVGDPVYNSADSRRVPSASLRQAKNVENSVSLARLAGSGREVSIAAKLSGMPDTKLLLGSDANAAALREALSKVPELLHFAVHVVSPQGRPEEAALALSLSSENMPELLTREAIAAYRVPGTLVVLSGCASDQGKTIPGAGLIGLGRAWLLAGASAVVVSAWPTPDDSGRFFSAFYSHLQGITSGPLAERAAAALQQAQIEMGHSGSYRSSPSFWAAYSILSKE